MSRFRLPVGLLLLAGSLLVGSSSPVDASSLDATAWWSAANPGPVAVPPMVDVGPGDLLVQGAGAGDPDQDALRHAVAALRFTLADGEAPAVLVLDVTSALPPESGTLRACKVTAPFAPVENGSWADVPAHDCGTSVLGTVSGAAVIFPGMEAMAAGDQVAVLLVPEGVVRTVIHQPTSAALGVLAAPPDMAPSDFELPPLAPVDAALPLPSPPAASTPGAVPGSSPSTPSGVEVPAFGAAAQFRDPATGASAVAAVAVFLLLSPLATRRRIGVG
jgi:hypothetical protein